MGSGYVAAAEGFLEDSLRSATANAHRGDFRVTTMGDDGKREEARASTKVAALLLLPEDESQLVAVAVEVTARAGQAPQVVVVGTHPGRLSTEQFGKQFVPDVIGTVRETAWWEHTGRR